MSLSESLFLNCNELAAGASLNLGGLDILGCVVTHSLTLFIISIRPLAGRKFQDAKFTPS